MPGHVRVVAGGGRVLHWDIGGQYIYLWLGNLYIRGRYTYLTTFTFGAPRITMAKIARVVILHVDHHVTQRGNLCLPVFFSDADQEVCLGSLADFAQA